jgi:hypothetical protein
VAGKKKKPVGDGVDQPVGNLDAAALGSDVIPDVIQV